jgi:hypothetical protein
MADLIYLYGIGRRGFDVSAAPQGVEDASVSAFTAGAVCGLVSRLSASDYAPTEIETRSGDVSWLSPRAMAHDRVLTWAQDHGGVIPMPMFSMWASESSLRKSLEDQAPHFARIFERVAGADEFGLRIHRRDAEMQRSMHELDPEVAELTRAAKAASPGQRYLLERKLAEQAKGAVRAVSQRMAKEIFETLRQQAREAIARPIVPASDAPPDVTLVLNAAFLVDRAQLDAFRAALGATVREHQPRGLTFDFTGPWPPYHFVK